DSVCDPADKSLDLLEKRLGSESEIVSSLRDIGDATSPKGVALTSLVDEGFEVNGKKLGDREELEDEVRELEELLYNGGAISKGRNQYNHFNFEDPVLYSGLVGGKYKGLKLLDETSDLFELDYEVPDAAVIPTTKVEYMFAEEGILDELNQDIFNMDEGRREDILSKIEDTEIGDYIDLEEIRESIDGSSIIARSSMYGEDGQSNMAGTYESHRVESSGGLEEAVRNTIKSYFSSEAVSTREQIGLAHMPDIAVTVQNLIETSGEGAGAVLHLTEEEYKGSIAESPEKTVEGKGCQIEGDTIYQMVEDTPLEDVSQDLEKLHEIYGDIDLEFAIDSSGDVYATQMRPKKAVSEPRDVELEGAEEYMVKDLDQLNGDNLETGQDYRVILDFLDERENIMDRQGDVFDFIRGNEDNIVAVEGSAPATTHIPNKIEGHFGIPYRMSE
ncbi:MAG: PEP/pyruvate-binding domain-containing protein, partial [Candidatus Nanohaloarchaea archaeon]